MESRCDFLILGSGLAGLSLALKLAELGDVMIVAKAPAAQTNTAMAQGGIAAVLDTTDSFESHIEDTLAAGAGLCDLDVVRDVVKQAPQLINGLVQMGVPFDRSDDTNKSISLTREGGHAQRRIVHVQDHTGADIEQVLLSRARAHKRIEFIEDEIGIDLITERKATPRSVQPNRCFGAYTLNKSTNVVWSRMAPITFLATGGAGRTYLYTTNWEGATGDGIAMAYRAGARVMNLEFMQFHPTCLYHHQERNLLITEAVRGEGGELVNTAGEAFMSRFDRRGSLAPRDIVARSIDFEMKRTGAPCVYLDLSSRSAEFITTRFPSIYNKCLQLGLDITRTPIPVVPAAHYLCGGVMTDRFGRTDIAGLYAVGETACTGLHGANRLASNSLLECLAIASNAVEFITKNPEEFRTTSRLAPEWIHTYQENSDELVVIAHMWDEIRRLMWNYVGIVRSNRRLFRAQTRLRNILSEVREYYWNFKLHPDILELRNIALVAHLTVECALRRKESRGIHFNLDFPEALAAPAQDSIVSPMD